ncbi:MAG: hypothetical protein QG578_1897 [Thermodesulfobacteriota bacterium]|nr:hypothetical protein [Thermodesulfobacteriota bacterium]
MKLPVHMFLVVCLVLSVCITVCKKEVVSLITGGKKIRAQVEKTIIFPYRPDGLYREPQETEAKRMKGSIAIISPDIGQVIIKDKSGREIFLCADMYLDLKGFGMGDKVLVEYTPDLFIKSIDRQQSG